jgi:hypothetical protein
LPSHPAVQTMTKAVAISGHRREARRRWLFRRGRWIPHGSESSPSSSSSGSELGSSSLLLLPLDLKDVVVAKGSSELFWCELSPCCNDFLRLLH